MDFYYWPSAPKWGLPSFDIKSLHVLTYIKLSGAEVNLHPTTKSWFPKEHKTLPCLCTPDDGLIDKPEDIIKYLRKQGFDMDLKFNIDVANNILPLSALISERLLPAVLSTIWMDNVNFKEVSHSMYARSCKYPLNFVTPNSQQKEAENFVKEFKFVMDNDEKVIAQIRSDAQATLNLLSEYLGEKEYIFGKDPSSLDALLISILAPLLKLPFTSSKLQNYLKSCPNICQYINRILKKCSREPVMFDAKHVDASTTDTSDATNPESTDWKYDVVFPLAVATVAMLSYAANAGLLTTNS